MADGVDMKQCIECGETKSLSEYNFTNGKKHPRSRCKPCQNAHQKKLRDARFAKDPEKRDKYLADKRERRMAKYELTQDEFLAMAKAQENRCFTCHRKLKLYVDHNHSTGKVRALLCNRCNRVLGFLEEDPQLMQSLINYVREFNP